MELKQAQSWVTNVAIWLLIVPYGIETRVLRPVTFDAYAF